MRAVRALARLLRVLVHCLHGWLVIRLRFPVLSADQQGLRVQLWSAQLLQLLGIGLRVEGTPPVVGPVLLVSNHISWLDIATLHAARHCRFVSKADVRRWPLIGTLATGAGTLYIERESRRDAMRVVHQMADRLRQADILAIFPEGTTSNGIDLLPFHANLIQAAISAGAPVQPVALRFVDTASGQTTLAPCYVGDDSLLGSLWRTVTAPPITAVVRYGALQRADGRERRAWAADLHAAVAALRTG